MSLKHETLLEMACKTRVVDPREFSVLFRNHAKLSVLDTGGLAGDYASRFANLIGVDVERVRAVIDGGEPSRELLDALGFELVYTGKGYTSKR